MCASATGCGAFSGALTSRRARSQLSFRGRILRRCFHLRADRHRVPAPYVDDLAACSTKPPVIKALRRLTTLELAKVLARDVPAVWAAQLAHRSAPARGVPPGWPCSASTRLRSSGWRLEEASARPGFCGAMAVEMNILRRIQAREWTARRASRLSCFSGLARQGRVIFHFCRSTMAPRQFWPTMWNEFLPISNGDTRTQLDFSLTPPGRSGSTWPRRCSSSPTRLSSEGDVFY